MKTITVALEFAGLVLPVTKNEKGQDIVPIKPITELFKLDWKSQYDRIQVPAIARRLGVCMGDMPHAGQVREMVCIRLDRVSAFLNSINPDKVRGGGNEAGADFLVRKQEEWDDLIHEYEVSGGILSHNAHLQERLHLHKVKAFLAINRERRLTHTLEDRKALGYLAANLADELGVSFQPELDMADSVVRLAKEAEALADKVLRAKVIQFIDHTVKRKHAA